MKSYNNYTIYNRNINRILHYRTDISSIKLVNLNMFKEVSGRTCKSDRMLIKYLYCSISGERYLFRSFIRCFIFLKRKNTKFWFQQILLAFINGLLPIRNMVSEKRCTAFDSPKAGIPYTRIKHIRGALIHNFISEFGYEDALYKKMP